MTGFGFNRPRCATIALTLLVSTACPATVLAQQTVGPADPSVAPPPGDPIGPPQLKGFDLQGTRVVPAQPQSAPPLVIAPPPPAPEPRAATPAQLPRQTAPVQTTSRPAPPPAPSPSVSAPSPAPLSGSQPGFSMPDLPEPQAQPPLAAEPQPATLPPMEIPAEPAASFTWLYGVALALAAGMVGFLLRSRRRRSRERLAYQIADAGDISASEIIPPARPLERAGAQAPVSPPPAPKPVARAPEPVDADPPAYLVRPAAPQSEPAAKVPEPLQGASPPRDEGLVGIQIRPWLQVQFRPDRATATDTEAAVQFELVIANTGNAAATNVRLDARMFNAGPALEQEIESFFAAPVSDGAGGALPVIQPRTAASLRSTVSMPKALMREIEVNGRRLFIPTVAISVAYEWGTGKVGRTSMSFLVGREAEDPTSKMSPFRLDQGPRVYRQVGQRQSQPAVLV